MASESRIRDVDMATEMVNFTKLQILQQAGTSMLAQANQAPQGVLSLLRIGTRGTDRHHITPPRDGSTAGGLHGPPVVVKGPPARCRITGREHHPSHALRHSRVHAQRATSSTSSLRCLVSLQATAPDADVLVRRRREPRPELVAGSSSPARSSASAHRLQRRELRLLRDRQRRPRARARTWAATPSSSTPTSSSSSPAGSTACASAHRHGGPPGRRGRRPPALPQRPHPARRHLLLAAAPRLAAPLPLRARRPARGAHSRPAAP